MGGGEYLRLPGRSRAGVCGAHRKTIERTMQNEATATTAQSSSIYHFNVEEKLLCIGADAEAERSLGLNFGVEGEGPEISLHTFGT